MSPSTLIVALILHSLSVRSQQCAHGNSYCISGLKLLEVNSHICNQYLSQNPLTLNNCSYFKSVDHMFIYKETITGWWVVDTNISNSRAYAWCKEGILDDCGKGKWYYSDGGSPYINYELEIKECSYDNTLCEASYSENDTYCIANTTHRLLNAIIARQYVFKGCHMEQPYFVGIANFTSLGVVINVTLLWDDILTSWHVASTLGSAASHYAYCTKSEITECDQNWYVYDGPEQGTNLDKHIRSAYCDSFVIVFLFTSACLI